MATQNMEKERKLFFYSFEENYICTQVRAHCACLKYVKTVVCTVFKTETARRRRRRRERDRMCAAREKKCNL